MIKTRWAAILLVLAALAIAAGEPLGSRDAEQYGRVMGQAGTVVTITPSGASGSQPLESEVSTSTRAVFGWASVTVVSPASEGTACWSMDPDLEIGSQGTEQATQLGSSLVGCNGYSFQALESHDMMPEYQVMRRRRVGWTGTYCDRPVVGEHGVALFPACNDTADCDHFFGAGSGATCSRTDHSQGGLYLIASDGNTWRHSAER